jgi:hypothetical protein
MVNRAESSNVQNFIPSRSLRQKGITRFLTSLSVCKMPLVQNLMTIWQSMVTPPEEIRFTVNANSSASGVGLVDDRRAWPGKPKKIFHTEVAKIAKGAFQYSPVSVGLV